MSGGVDRRAQRRHRILDPGFPLEEKALSPPLWRRAIKSKIAAYTERTLSFQEAGDEVSGPTGEVDWPA